MDIEHSHLIELYQSDLVQHTSAGVIIPKGFITSTDGHIQGVQFQAGEEIYTLNIEQLSNSNKAIHSELLKQGLALSIDEVKVLQGYIPKWLKPKNKSLLNQYIAPERNGFIDNKLIYILGPHVYCNQDLEKQSKETYLPLKLPITMQNAFEEIGCRETYKNVVLNESASHFNIFAVLTALSASLTGFVNIDGGGFHLFGPSGVGKTIGLKIAASVMGSSSSPDQGSQESCYMMSWGSTKNGIEAKYNLFNNGLLILDELGKYTSKNVGADVYAIAGGSYTARMNSSLESVEERPASFMLLSSGELSMPDMLRLNRETSIGQGKSVRMPGIPIMSSDLNDPKFYPDSETASKVLEETINNNSGFLFKDFIKKLLNHKQSYDELRMDVKARFESVLAEMKNRLPNNSSIEFRVLKRFALVGVGGQLAHEFGVLPWNDEKVMEALSFVYKRYHSYEPNRLNDADIAFRKMKRKLQSEEGNFVRVTSATAPNKHYGYISDTHYYIYPEAFRGWLSSANESDVIQLLRKNKLLKSEAGRNRLRTTEHLPKKGRVRCHNKDRQTFYCISRDIVSLEFD